MRLSASPLQPSSLHAVVFPLVPLPQFLLLGPSGGIAAVLTLPAFARTSEEEDGEVDHASEEDGQADKGDQRAHGDQEPMLRKSNLQYGQSSTPRPTRCPQRGHG